MTRAAALLVLGFGWGIGSAQAAVAPALSLEQQARRADLIVRGSLGAPQEVTAGGTSWRVYPLALTETVAGTPARLPQQGGQPALYVWAEAGDLPQWRTGQDAFFLLYTARLDSPLVGYNQGYYPVVNGTVVLPGTPAPAAPATQAGTRPLPPGGTAEPQRPAGDLPSTGRTESELGVDEFRSLLLRARSSAPQRQETGP